MEKHEKKWKQRFVKIYEYNEKMQRELQQSKDVELQIGPENFVPIMKLGQGSFGQVYLVDKIFVNKDGTIRETNKQYAMKILNKKQILG